MEIDLAWISSYFSLLPFWHLVAAAAFALTPPTIFLATSRRSAVFGFPTILILYAVVLFLGLCSLWMLGIVLQSAAPNTFELWRKALNSGSGRDPASIIRDLLFALPLMILVSSTAYALVGQSNRIAKAVMGIVCAAAAYGAMFAGIIVVACSAWASCI